MNLRAWPKRSDKLKKGVAVDLLAESQSVTEEELVRAAESLPPAYHAIGEFIATLPADLQKAWTFVRRTADKFELENSDLKRDLVTLLVAGSRVSSVYSLIEERMRTINQKLQTQMEAFWVEVCGRFNLSKGVEIVLVKDWSVHFSESIQEILDGGL